MNVILVAGTIFLDKISRASASPWANTVFTFNLIYVMISLSPNIVLSLIPLDLHRRWFTKLLAVMFVMVLWFLIPFGIGNRLQTFLCHLRPTSRAAKGTNCLDVSDCGL